MKSIRFVPAAEEEMSAAAAYYEGQRHLLGRRFLAAVRESLDKIRIAPDVYPVVDSDVRRCLTKIFPHAVLYRTTPQAIEIIAVMHLHREPDYWIERLDAE